MRWPPLGFTGLPAAPSSPWLKGRNTVAGPSSFVTMCDFAVAHGEMHQRAVGKRQQRLGGLALWAAAAVKAILVDGVADALGEIGLQFDRGDRQAVEEQHEVDAVLVVQGIMHLPHHAQPVGGVAGEDVGIDGQRRFELRQLQRLLQAEQFDAVPQHVQRAALVELIAQAGQQGFAGLVRRGSWSRVSHALRLRGLHPGQHVGREKCARRS